MTDSFQGTRYDIVKSLEEDVDLLLKRAAELVRSHNKCSKEVEALSKEVETLNHSNNDIHSSMRDIRSVMPKEIFQRLYSQLSDTVTSDLGVLRNDMEGSLQQHILNITNKLQQLQLLYQTKEEAAAVGRNMVTHQDLEELETDLQASFKQFRATLSEATVAIKQSTQEQTTTEILMLKEQLTAEFELSSKSSVTQEQLQLLKGEVVDQQQLISFKDELSVERQRFEQKFEELKERQNTGYSDEKLQALLATKIPLPVEVDGVTPAVLTQTLTEYLRKEDALQPDNVRALLGTAVTRVEYAKDQERLPELYLSKQVADNSYLTRGEFDALKTIIITKNDLQSWGKNELDELRGEQEMLKRSVPTRDHLNLLRAECDSLRDTCNSLEARLEKPAPNGDMRAEVEQLKLQIAQLTTQCQPVAPVAVPETKSFDLGTATFKYMKIGDIRFLISNGFPLSEPEVTFQLDGIELPVEKIPASTGSGYISTLNEEGSLVFKRNADAVDVSVRRFMFWY